MVMLRKKGKPQKIAEDVLKQKGIKVPKATANESKNKIDAYLMH